MLLHSKFNILINYETFLSLQHCTNLFFGSSSDSQNFDWWTGQVFFQIWTPADQICCQLFVKVWIRILYKIKKKNHYFRESYYYLIKRCYIDSKIKSQE